MATNKKIFIEIITKTSGAEKGLNQVGNAVGNASANADKASKSFLGLGRTFAAIARGFVIVKSIQLLSKAIINAAKVSADFELAMKKVKAVTQASEKEFANLTNSARELALGTIFTAQQVSELQLAYSKLGFTTDEILNATEATLHLATATGEDLAGAADVVGSTIRGFNLDASEAARVADVMGSSFSSSALNLESFKQSMKTVAPIANSANINLEMTTALLSVLADAGLRGTRAATGLKNLISEMVNPTSELSKEIGFTVKNASDLGRAFQVLAEKNIDLAKATQLVDKRSLAAFGVLTRSVHKIDELNKSYETTTGSIKNMSNEISDTLVGDFAQLKSAIDEAFLDNTNGVNAVLREATQLATGFFNLFSNKDAIISRYKDLLSELSFNVDTASLGQLESEILVVEQDIVDVLASRADFYVKIKGSTQEQAEFLAKETEEYKAQEKLLKRLKKELEEAKSGVAVKSRIKLLEDENKKHQQQINHWKDIRESSAQYGDEIENRTEIISENVKEIERLKNILNEIKPPDPVGWDSLREWANSLEGIQSPAAFRQIYEDLEEANKQMKEFEGGMDAYVKLIPPDPVDESFLGQMFRTEDFRQGLEEAEELLLNFNDLFQTIQQNRLNATIAANDQEMASFDALQSDKLERFNISQQYETDSFVGTQQQKADFEKQQALERLEFEQNQEAKRQELRKKQIKAENEIAKKAFIANKASSMAQVGINLAKELSAISVNSAANPANAFTFGAAGASQFGILSALAITNAALQTATIASQKFTPITFEEGGSIVGPSHSEGGVPFTVGGSAGFEAEGGEYIFSRKTVDRLGTGLLDAINFGGASPRLFADGGVVSASSVSQNAFGGMEMAEMIGSIIAQTVTEIPVVNVATDTLNTGRAVQSAQDMASF